MVQARKFYLSLVGVVAWSSTAANTILTILETTSFSATQSSLLPMSTASSIFNSFSLGCIGFYVFQRVRKNAPRDSSALIRAMEGVAIFISGIAIFLGLALIALIKSRWFEVIQHPSPTHVPDWSSLVPGQIAVWTISFTSQIALYTAPLWQRQTPTALSITMSGPRDSVMSEMHASHQGKNLFMMEPTQPSSPFAAALPSPTFSSRSSHSLNSWRDSLRHVVRPATSRTTLVSQRSFNRDARSIYSQAESVDNVSHSDGFESWDTSSVSLQARDALLLGAPSKGTVLDPIPGSRPATPARALEGSYLTELPEEDELQPPPKMIADISRPPSPAVSEAHIHPLFRSESPVPPPDATPGTSILASPLSNQAISCPTRPFNRMRSNSVLSQSQRAARSRNASPHTSTRDPSPVSRALTPPFPDFVLNSSPRSSMSGTRRVQLQLSPDR